MKQDQEKQITTINDMKKGKVKWYNDAKGFGFIESENGEDIFVHRSGLTNSYQVLQPDEEVEYETQQGEKGLMAVNVKLAE
jgi:cold shock protein